MTAIPVGGTLAPRHNLPSRFRSWLASDAVVQIIMALSLLARGTSYLPVSHGPASHPAEKLLDLGIWAWIWIGCGLLCVIASACPRGWTAAIALGLASGLHLLWAASFMAAFIVGDSSRGWVSAIGYLCLGIFALWGPWALAQARRSAAPSNEEVARALRDG